MYAFWFGFPGWVYRSVIPCSLALLARLNRLLVLNWRQKSAARSSLKLAIEDTLDTLPAAYDRPLYSQKCTALFEHVYESYPERNAGVYAAGA
jgi:type I restriction enzyme R subunit